MGSQGKLRQISEKLDYPVLLIKNTLVDDKILGDFVLQLQFLNLANTKFLKLELIGYSSGRIPALECLVELRAAHHYSETVIQHKPHNLGIVQGIQRYGQTNFLLGLLAGEVEQR